MAKGAQFTAEVSEGREELLDGGTVARIRTVEIKDRKGAVVRRLKAADNDEDVRAKLQAAGYPVEEWAGGDAPATVIQVRNPLISGCLWFAVVAVALVVWAVVATMTNPARDDHEEWDAKIACEGLVKEQLRAPSTAKFSNETATGGPDSWTVTGLVEAQNAFGGTVGHRYSCSVTFTGEDEYRGNATIQE